MTSPPSHPPGRDPAPPIRADLAHQRAGARLAWGRALAAGGFGWALAIGLTALWVWRLAFAGLPAIPDSAVLWSMNRPPGMTFLDRSGAVIAVRGPRHGEAVGLAAMPPYLPRAFLAAEDRRFYSHHGVDFVGVARAALADLRARRVVQGGSTITQQVARNLFLGPEQTLRRKLQEAVLAWRLEGALTKDQILDLYLNRIYFGDGAYGVDAAAQVYFGTSARRLTLAEAALLAALPEAPTRLDPANDMGAALRRSRLVLERMVRAGWITQAQARAASRAPPRLAPERPEETDEGYVLDAAAQQARALTGGRVPDLVVRLTVDARLQAVAQDIVRQGVAEGRRSGATEAALVALDTDGAIRALVGGVDHRDSAYDRATQALRQPGSAFKPFVYAAALEAGVRPEDVRNDQAIRFAGWSPENYGGGYSGAVTVQDALARSINTVAVELAHEVGPSAVAELARRFGLKSIPPHPALPVALGAYEVTLLDLVSAYRVFQDDGRWSAPYLISEIATARGEVVYRRGASAPTQVYDVERDHEMVRMMQGVLTRGTGRSAAFGWPAAGKTGTSQDWRDAWFVGFTPAWTAGVWVGDDRARPMDHVAGGDLPAEMWRRFMIQAHQGLTPHDFPGLAPAPVPPPAAGEGTADEVAANTEDDADADDEQTAGDQSRSGFYAGLADDFSRTAAGRGPQ